MTDMRNFGATNDIRAESAFVDSDTIVKQSYALEESGEGLGGFHRNPEEFEDGGGRSKAISALIVMLMVGAVGAYAYSMYTPSNQIVAAEDAARPAPTNTAAMTPPPPVVAPEAANTAVGESLATAPTDTNMNAATPAATPAPVATPATRQAAAPRVAAPVTRTAQVPLSSPVTATPPVAVAPQAPAPVENQAAAVPEPVSPTPPASAVAGNPPLNQQSAPVESAPVTPATPVEAAPVASAPAQTTPAAEAAPVQ